MTEDFLSFFNQPENAPHNGVDTSIDAAESISESLSAMRLQVFQEIQQAKDGLTCDEIEQVLGMKHQTASARLNDLMKAEPPVLCFLIDEKTNKPRRRATRSGRTARIYFPKRLLLPSEDGAMPSSEPIQLY